MLRKRPKQLLFSAPPFSPEALGGVGSQGSEAGEGGLEKGLRKIAPSAVTVQNSASRKIGRREEADAEDFEDCLKGQGEQEERGGGREM